ncbi:MAG: hypothetical protein SFU86_00755 [Pirellulaceae bacterium]|nr:hypothetical protein [Pirellulaceae bacterium]
MQGVNIVIAIVSLCCYFYVIYTMFNNAQTVLGIICLVGACVLGIGGLVAFVYGWIKAREWEIVPVMGVWTGCIAANIVIAVIQAMQAG